MKRFKAAILAVLPSTAQTCWWMVRLTVLVSLAVFLLRHFQILPFISGALEPVFAWVGLPGEASLAYVSGYFVNVYSAIAVAVTLDMDPRAMTILGVMVLCSHNMFVETAIQRKTGSSWGRLVLVRTLSGIFLAWLLHQVLPLSSDPMIGVVSPQVVQEQSSFGAALGEWLRSVAYLSIKMSVLIFVLNILQKLLAEYGVTRWLSGVFAPLLRIFGLPSSCSFLWIVANTLGLAYGGAAMLDEVRQGKLTQQEIDLLNMHIGISHSNLEDLILFVSIGAVGWVLLMVRWGMSIILVWGYRLERLIRNKCLSLRVDKLQE